VAVTIRLPWLLLALWAGALFWFAVLSFFF
jgi:hypothetical protein